MHMGSAANSLRSLRDEVEEEECDGIDVEKLSNHLKGVEEENHKFLQKLRHRIHRAETETAKIEIRYEHLAVEGYARVGSRALPTLFNATMMQLRMTLLLGPPGAGKTTFLLSLAGKLNQNLRHVHISVHKIFIKGDDGERDFGFFSRCLGVGTRYEMLVELLRHEKVAGIKPDPGIDAFMKGTSILDKNTSLVTDYILKVLGLDVCSDIMVGDDMRRGISGGQIKRVTTGEMLVGAAKALFMDEISTGLDSSTTFQILKSMRQMVHIIDVTMIIALLQPAPETYDLFDDIILLSEGQIVYQGPRENILEFFGYMGFKCPERKGVADFLQEVSSKKDQEQYWFKNDQPYRYISVGDFARAFQSFHIGQKVTEELAVPYDKSKAHTFALVKEKYGISNWELIRACFSREWLLMTRNSFIYVFKTVQITIMAIITFTVFFRTKMPHGELIDGDKFLAALFFSLTNVLFNGLAELVMTLFRLPVFYKQRDLLFYPAWAFGLPIWILGVPLSFLESAIWIILTYYTIGFAPAANSIHNMAIGLFRFISAVGRTQVVASTFATFTSLVVLVLGGYMVSKDDLEPWLKWAYYIFPLSYGQNAVSMTNFLTKDGVHQIQIPDSMNLLSGKSSSNQGAFIQKTIALGDSSALILDESASKTNKKSSGKSVLETPEGVAMEQAHTSTGLGLPVGTVDHASKKGMILTFQSLSLVFNHINYYVDVPAVKILGVYQEMKGQGFEGGYIEGDISISGYPKNQATFARISGYCEQNDIHSPHVTVYESVLYSAWLRLPIEVNKSAREVFVEEVMALVELNPIRNSVVGLPGIDGLSTEQRKRLTIAVELVSNPSIIFMDEPTSGLDARAAAIIMRTVRNAVDTGRTIVCTIHQPSIDIFESFDELFLLKRGGWVIYAGPLGCNSHKLIEYFEAIPGVPKVKDGCNPATWMLDVSTPEVEVQLGVDFADTYAKSSLYQSNQEDIKELSSPTPGFKGLYFPTKYSQPFLNQCKACFWKQYWSYWRNPQYNATRYCWAIVIGFTLGIVFWNNGQKIEKQQDLRNLLGAIYCTVIFVGATNSYSVQGVVAMEKTVFYRERAARMYSALPYAFAQVAIEMIYIAVQTVVYSLVFYPIIGFKWTVGKFFWFFYFSFMSFTYCTLYGMMVAALTPGSHFSAVLSSYFFSIWNLFSGFLIPRMQIPIWWRWCYWASPVAWTIYGLVTSQLGDITSEIEVPGVGAITVEAYLKEILHLDHDFLPILAVMHLLFVLLCALVFALAIKHLNFQTR
ncbi:UNVERIFIED_CONTAM: ABC transporter G family member 39 [Sesamum calycinum]|uniref:ABC transporter G family member 39 n=1 Tax=Sesamum calycinum TaxID=2727403 RepID=A0AAW2NWQ3_9LAMI